jgi:valine--pyruvate aminotransferase
MKFSRFAEKFNGDSGILQLMNDLGHAVNLDREIHMLGGGNPASIPQIEACYRSEMLQLLENGGQFERMVGNYDSPQGNQQFIDALAELLKDTYGWPISARNIAITNGSQASFGILFNLFSGQYSDGIAKKVLLPMTPEYIGYNDVGPGDSKIFKANRPVLQMDPDDSLFYKYRVDFSELSISEEIGAICISRPTNPTGNVVTDNELAKLREMASNTGIPLILDGAYGLPFPGIIFTPAKPVWDNQIILCLSLSKLGLPGARTGIVIAHPDVIDIMSGTNAVFNLAPGRFGPSLLTRLVQSKELISMCESVITPYYKRRVDQTVALVRKYMKDLPVRIHKPEGAMFLWMWFDGLPISSELFYKKLKQCGVYIIPGNHFFPGLDDDNWDHKQQCIRVSYAGNEGQVEKGIKIIAREARRAYKMDRVQAH